MESLRSLCALLWSLLGNCKSPASLLVLTFTPVLPLSAFPYNNQSDSYKILVHITVLLKAFPCLPMSPRQTKVFTTPSASWHIWLLPWPLCLATLSRFIYLRHPDSLLCPKYCRHNPISGVALASPLFGTLFFSMSMAPAQSSRPLLYCHSIGFTFLVTLWERVNSLPHPTPFQSTETGFILFISMVLNAT